MRIYARVFTYAYAPTQKKKSEEKINEIIPKGIGILEFRTDGWSLFRCVCVLALLSPPRCIYPLKLSEPFSNGKN